MPATIEERIATLENSNRRLRLMLLGGVSLPARASAGPRQTPDGGRGG